MYKKKLISLAVAVIMLLTVFTTTSFAATTQDSNGEYLQQVMKLIEEKYNGTVDEEELVNSSVKAMFNTLDQYSTFYSAQEFDEVYGTLEGEVEGIGIQVEKQGDYIAILKVYTGSPAQKSGLLTGDRIAEVNGKSVKGLELEEVIGLVKGQAGTTVKVGILRQGSEKIATYSMKRAQITIPSVFYEIRGTTGYMKIDSFVSNTATEVREAVNYFDDNRVKNVVLDLRDNPGGLVDQSVEVAKMFVPKGLITTLDYKDPSEVDEKYYSTLDKVKYNLAVLVNENTASASEILTGAIRDTKAGVVLGTKTFGKAKVQSFIPILTPEAYARLNEASADKTVNALEVDAYETDLLGWAKMTIGLYYTPNGECIDLKGINPDIEVQEAGQEIPVNQLEKLTVTVKPALNTQYLDVLNAECILKLLNYDVDAPDMTLDQKTFQAIKKFQKDQKVYSYGVLDFTTQKLLNLELKKLQETSDAVYVKAVQELQN